MRAVTYGVPIPSKRLGLSASGTNFVKDGMNWRGIGVSHFDLMISAIQGGLGTDTDYRLDIPAIAAWGIPFIRFSAGFYNQSSWYAGWHNDKATYLAKMDEVVALAEANRVGLAPVFLWSARGFTDSVYSVYGIYEPPKMLAYTSSKSWALFVEFITTIVTRYKNSPAILMWELGNEIVNAIGPEYYSTWALDGTHAAWLNWGTNPAGAIYKPTDKMSMQEWQQFTLNAVALINSLDPHQRIISGGSPIGNQFAVGAQTANTLTSDTLAQWQGVASTENLPWVEFREKAFPVLTNHIYPQGLSNTKFFTGAEKTQAELIALSKGWSDAAGKPFYLGEWGATYHGDSVDEISTDLSTETANFNAALAAVVANDVKVSTLWNYGGNFAGGSAWMKWKLKDPSRTYQLTAIAAANAAMRT